jgi:hypothetical protein
LAVLSKMTTTTNRHFSNQTQKWNRLWIWMVWSLCDLKKGEGHVMATKPKTVFLRASRTFQRFFHFAATPMLRLRWHPCSKTYHGGS